MILSFFWGIFTENLSLDNQLETLECWNWISTAFPLSPVALRVFGAENLAGAEFYENLQLGSFYKIANFSDNHVEFPDVENAIFHVRMWKSLDREPEEAPCHFRFKFFPRNFIRKCLTWLFQAYLTWKSWNILTHQGCDFLLACLVRRLQLRWISLIPCSWKVLHCQSLKNFNVVQAWTKENFNRF